MDFPREPGQIVKQDEDLEKFNMARVEPYITPEGEKKWAIAYGIRPSELNVWYHLEEVKNFFTNWSMPTKPRWKNVQQWRKSDRAEPFKQKTGLDSRDNSRSRNRNRSSSRRRRSRDRGSYGSRNRSSGIGRGGKKDYYSDEYPTHTGRERERRPSYDENKKSHRRKRSPSYNEKRYRRERSDSRDSKERRNYYGSSRSGR